MNQRRVMEVYEDKVKMFHIKCSKNQTDLEKFNDVYVLRASKPITNYSNFLTAHHTITQIPSEETDITSLGSYN